MHVEKLTTNLYCSKTKTCHNEMRDKGTNWGGMGRIRCYLNSGGMKRKRDCMKSELWITNEMGKPMRDG